MENTVSPLTWDEALERCRDLLDGLRLPWSGAHMLLAVSGGVDSMTMLSVMRALGVDCSVAHVNYNLRGEESVLDADLVATVCEREGLAFHLKEVDLNELLREHGGNLQVTARDIRYQWFEELCTLHGYRYVCTAHHMDDSAETFFINLLRGTGLRGLTGIQLSRDHYVRPMMCFTRSEIMHIATERGIEFREDTSNSSEDYLRNRIRKHILPAFEQESPGFVTRMSATQDRLRGEWSLIEASLAEWRERILSSRDKMLVIDRTELLSTPAPDVVLYELIRAHGFSWYQCRQVVEHPAQAGVKFLSGTHVLHLDRDEILIAAVDADSGSPQFELQGEGVYTLPEGALHITRRNSVEFSEDNRVQVVDAVRFSGQLSLRRWQPGDFFYPLGAGGRQKLQDFFTNEKWPAPAKASAWLLTVDGDIAWICGSRLDERFKVTDQTKSYLELRWTPAAD